MQTNEKRYHGGYESASEGYQSGISLDEIEQFFKSGQGTSEPYRQGGLDFVQEMRNSLVEGNDDTELTSEDRLERQAFNHLDAVAMANMDPDDREYIEDRVYGDGYGDYEPY